MIQRSVPDTCSYVGLLKARNTESSSTFLLKSIGRLYELGVQVETRALYPSVEYPVPVATPMLAPLLKWDHSADWTVKDWREFMTDKTQLPASEGANHSSQTAGHLFEFGPFDDPESEVQIIAFIFYRTQARSTLYFQFITIATKPKIWKYYQRNVCYHVLHL